MADEYAPYELDPRSLDEEWVNQPRLYFYAAKEWADARKAHGHLEIDKEVSEKEIKEVQASVALEIRQDPKKFGLEKVTDEGVKSVVTIDSRCKKAFDEYIEISRECIDARHLVDVLKAKADALDHRKKALEDLVYMQGREYFSVPKAPRESRERMSEVEKKAVRKRGQRNANG